VEAKKPSLFKTYLERIAAFSPNARKYLIGAIIYGSAMGVYQLLFNFYVLSLGYNEAVLGNLVTARSATSLIVALPMGYLANKIGHKRAFMIGYGGVGLAILFMLLLPSVPMFVVMNIIIGLPIPHSHHHGAFPHGKQRREGTHISFQLQLGLEYDIHVHRPNGLAATCPPGQA